MKNKVLVLGYFGYVTNQLDGQTVRTRNVYELLKAKGESLYNISYFDTQQFQNNRLSLLKMVWQILKCSKLVYLPAHDNLKYIFPLIYLICRLKRVELLYIVVGGWLAEYLETKKLHVALLSKISGIFPQSAHLKDKLKQKYHFNNVIVFPNFRMHSFVPSFSQNEDVFKIVFMARITRTKGIDIICRLAEYIEKELNIARPITIDFYGPIAKNEEAYFRNQIEKFTFVSYKGILEPDDIYKTLEKYDLSVLPTKYPGEGFPGTILDSYISGLPVIVSNWKYLPEFVDEGVTGYIFDLNKEKEFYNYVDKLYHDRPLLLKMKQNAFEKSKMYSSENAWYIIKDYLID